MYGVVVDNQIGIGAHCQGIDGCYICCITAERKAEFASAYHLETARDAQVGKHCLPA